MGNFILFEQEVKDTLNSSFEKHQTEQNVCTSLTFVYTTWPYYRRRDYHLAEEYAKTAERKDTSTRSLDDSLHTRLPSKDFQFFHGSCTKCSIFIRCSCTETTETDAISYTNQNRLLRDFARLCDTTKESIEVYFSKGSKVPRGNAKVIVSVDKPFVISYFKKKQKVMLKCHYNFTNEYGYTFES